MEGRFIIDGHVHCGPRSFQGSGAFNIQAGGTDKEVGNPFERLKKNLEDIGSLSRATTTTSILSITSGMISSYRIIWPNSRASSGTATSGRSRNMTIRIPNAINSSRLSVNTTFR